MLPLGIFGLPGTLGFLPGQRDLWSPTPYFLASSLLFPGTTWTRAAHGIMVLQETKTKRLHHSCWKAKARTAGVSVARVSEQR